MNTVVHPFILADNRHYVFYVFRWFILRHSLARYALAPAYVACAWAVMAALAGSPKTTVAAAAAIARSKGGGKAKADANEEVQRTDWMRGSSAGGSGSGSASRNGNGNGIGSTGVRTSFVLIWLLASAASVVTAPLVEPRYFVVAWIMWRMKLPPPQPQPQRPPALQPSSRRGKASSSIESVTSSPSVVLWLETAWLLLVNAATCYVFLYRGFEWKQEEGRVQRFIW